MRKLERHCLNALVSAAVDSFVSDWSYSNPDIEIEIREIHISDDGMMARVSMLVDVYERTMYAIIYSDIYTCAGHIYEELWREASKGW